MEEQIIVLGVNNWSMEGKAGTTAFYIPANPVDEEQKRGFFPVKLSVKSQKVAAIINSTSLPAKFTMKFSLASNVGGKMEVNVTDLVNPMPIDLFESTPALK